jgi:hypothetical protein
MSLRTHSMSGLNWASEEGSVGATRARRILKINLDELMSLNTLSAPTSTFSLRYCGFTTICRPEAAASSASFFSSSICLSRSCSSFSFFLFSSSSRFFYSSRSLLASWSASIDSARTRARSISLSMISASIPRSKNF